MKVYISADIEGVAGVVHSEHTMRDGREHDLARKLMTDEVNACIKGAIEAGAQEVVVNDSHGTMRNIFPDRLHSEAQLLMGAPKKLAMVEGLDETYDAAMFVGYHTMAGANGVLNHTFSGKAIQTIRVNGVEMGEFALNALVAGSVGVPTTFVSGCDLLALEARSFITTIETVVVKESISRTAALNASPAVAQSTIQQAAKKSLERLHDIHPYVIDGPYVVEIEFLNTGFADAVEILPIYNRKNAKAIQFTNDDWQSSYRLIRGAIMVAHSVQ